MGFGIRLKRQVTIVEVLGTLTIGVERVLDTLVVPITSISYVNTLTIRVPTDWVVNIGVTTRHREHRRQ